MQWMIRNTFIEFKEAELQSCRPRAVSDFDVVYSPVLVNSIEKIDEYEVESAASTSLGSWADESDNELESIFADVSDATRENGVCSQTACWPALPMMQYTFPVCVNSHSQIRQEAPILPKPVQEQKVKKGEVRTTVMIRNMPNNYTRKMLLELLDLNGFAASYDFVYLPIDFETKACLGYAFINMATPVAANQFWKIFNGFSNWSIPSRNVAGVSWSGPHQGLQAHIERYSNSSIMCDGTPDDYKPIILSNGVRVPFPAATRKLRSSRQPCRR
jgi:hypothetical protein